jgi:hypothetical protein
MSEYAQENGRQQEESLTWRRNLTFGFVYEITCNTEIPEMEFKASCEDINEANILNKKNAYFCLVIFV